MFFSFLRGDMVKWLIGLSPLRVKSSRFNPGQFDKMLGAGVMRGGGRGEGYPGGVRVIREG